MVIQAYTETEILNRTFAATTNLVDAGFLSTSIGYVLEVVHPLLGEYNWPRFTFNWTGSGTMSIRFVGASTTVPVGNLLSNIYTNGVTSVTKSQEYQIHIRTNKIKFSHIYVIINFSGDVSDVVSDLSFADFKAITGEDTLAGHVLRTLNFDGLVVPYRVMLPKNYDDTKSYPVVLSFGGSGSLGHTPEQQAIGMTEWLTLGYAAFSKYYHCDGNISYSNPNDKDYQCISVLVSGYIDFTGFYSYYSKNNCEWQGLTAIRNICPPVPYAEVCSSSLDSPSEEKIIAGIKDYFTIPTILFQSQ